MRVRRRPVTDLFRLEFLRLPHEGPSARQLGRRLDTSVERPAPWAGCPVVLAPESPPPNSLRARRALRSDSGGEMDDKARLRARDSRPALLGAPQARPSACRADADCGSPPSPARSGIGRRRLIGGCSGGRPRHGAGGGACWCACGAPRSAGHADRARSAPRPHACRRCLSAANAVSEASSAAGRRDRAPQGSRPDGPTALPKRQRAPPLAPRPQSNRTPAKT